MSADVLEARRGPWRFVWEGGRLADVYHDEYEAAINATSVGDYDFSSGRQLAHFTQRVLEAAADEWMRDSEPDYRRELPFL